MAGGRRGRRSKTGWSTDAQQVVDRVFVYGTLREGQAARSMVADHIARSRPATACGEVYAFADGFPGMVAGGERRVTGELLELTDLTGAFALLDAYEGDDFSRVLLRVRPEGGEEIFAWAYVLADERLAEEGRLLDDGDWVAHLERSR